MIGDFVRKANRSKENSVMTANLILPIFGQHIPMFGVIIIAGKIKMIEMQIDIKFAGYGFKCTQALWNNLFADAVSCNHRNIESILRHRLSLHILNILPTAEQPSGTI